MTMTDHDVLSIMSTNDGWLIKRRTCRIVWWDGNPLAQETIPGVRFKLESSVLRREGDAGRVGYLNAICSHDRAKS
jgi:hypothetical protein